jgi:hypothetical protein
MMQRRAFVTAMAAMMAAPLTVGGQPPAKLPRIGIVADGHPAPPEERRRSPLAQGLRDLGWEPGKTCFWMLFIARERWTAWLRSSQTWFVMTLTLFGAVDHGQRSLWRELPRRYQWCFGELVRR